jgi:phosphoribosyl-dephospho-CoA transferase
MILRHTRVWPTASGYAALASMASDPIVRAAIDLWSTRGWPLVVRRREDRESSSDTAIAIGLPLPPSLDKKRCAFFLSRDDIAAHAPPLALEEVIGRLPATRRRMLAPLARATARERIALRVFGSVAWQAETGLDYWHDDSDLDLIAAPKSYADLRSTIALLERAQERVAMRLDGEIVFPGGDAVAWREWADGDSASRVLVKNVSRVALVARGDLLSKLDRHERLAA